MISKLLTVNNKQFLIKPIQLKNLDLYADLYINNLFLQEPSTAFFYRHESFEANIAKCRLYIKENIAFNAKYSLEIEDLSINKPISMILCEDAGNRCVSIINKHSELSHGLKSRSKFLRYHFDKYSQYLKPTNQNTSLYLNIGVMEKYYQKLGLGVAALHFLFDEYPPTCNYKYYGRLCLTPGSLAKYSKFQYNWQVLQSSKYIEAEDGEGKRFFTDENDTFDTINQIIEKNKLMDYFQFQVVIK